MLVQGQTVYNKCRNIAPTILLDVPQESLIMNEEIFGPLLPIITVSLIEIFGYALFLFLWMRTSSHVLILDNDFFNL